MIKIRKIKNNSMLPTLKNGDYVFTKKKQKVNVKQAIGELYNLDKNPVEYLTSKPKNKYLKYLRKENQKIYNHQIKLDLWYFKLILSFKLILWYL